MYTLLLCCCYLFSFTDPAPTEIYTLSLHDALPISHILVEGIASAPPDFVDAALDRMEVMQNGLFWEVNERVVRSEEHTSELQSPMYLVCRLLLEKKKASK